MKLTRLLGAPWTQGERDAEEYDRATIVAGTGNSLTAEWAEGYQLTQIGARHARRRLRLRVLGAIVVIVAVSAFVGVFTTNRVVDGITVAASAVAAPVALYLGLRRD